MCIFKKNHKLDKSNSRKMLKMSFVFSKWQKKSNWLSFKWKSMYFQINKINIHHNRLTKVQKVKELHEFQHFISYEILAKPFAKFS